MTLQRIYHNGAAVPATLQGNITAGSTSCTISPASGWPASTFVMKIDAGTASEEKILCASQSSGSVVFQTRGYDGTAATSHTAGAACEHDVAAVVIDDLNDHVYTTTRSDHTQYALLAGATFTGAVTFETGITVVTGGEDVEAGTTVLQALTATSAAVSGAVTGASLAASLTGTTARNVGSTNGAPTSGTYNTDDYAPDPTNGVIWLCTAGGTPGTWVAVGDLPGAWTTYTPVWTASGSNPSLGNGTLTGSYRLVGNKTLLLRLSLGVGSSTTFGSGGWSFSLPATMTSANSGVYQLLNCFANSGGSLVAGTGVVSQNSTTVAPFLPSSTAPLLSQATGTAPFTWAVGSVLVMEGALELQ